MQLLSGTLQTAYASEKLLLGVDTYEFVLQQGAAVAVTKDAKETKEYPKGLPGDVFQFSSVLLCPIPSINGHPLGIIQLINRQARRSPRSKL